MRENIGKLIKHNPSYFLITALLIISSACGAAKDQAEDELTRLAPTETVMPTQTLPPQPTSPSTLTTTSAPLPTPIPTLGPPTCPSGGEKPPDLTFDFDNFESDLVSAQLLAYLDAVGEGAGLQDMLKGITVPEDSEVYIHYQNPTATIINADVTGDELEEVIVHFGMYGKHANVPDYGHQGYVYIYSCSDAVFREIFSKSLAALYGPPIKIDDEGIFYVGDLNQDGINEIVISSTHDYRSDWSPISYSRIFQIISWDGENFQDLIPEEVNPFNGAIVANGDIVIQDTDSNGTLELILTNDFTGAQPELGRKRTDTWMWNGDHFDVAQMDYSPPVLKIHATWDGDAAALIGEYDKALAFYQQAIFDTQLRAFDMYMGGFEQELFHVRAYSRYRIMLLHIVRGDNNAAQIVYDTLQKNFPDGATGYPYAFIASIFWETYNDQGQDIALACQAAQAYAEENPWEILHPLGDHYLIYDRYSPEDICPFGN